MKYQSPMYAMLGIDTKVRTDVSVATIESIAMNQLTFFVELKKPAESRFLSLEYRPNKIIPKVKRKSIM